MREITYAEALREALREEMKRDQNVFLLGEDIGHHGGIFKVTTGLVDEFGGERVRDTPISESAIIGAATGAAILGKRPVAEIMYMDFLVVCGDQIVNHLAKLRFMTAGELKVPVVIRTQCSLGRFIGAQHSQYFPSWFMNLPGIKLVVPSTPQDAKGLLKTAIRDENPVLFLEMASLYFDKGPVPEKEYTIPLGLADIKHPGDDVTVIAISSMVPLALNAANKLSEEGYGIEVIDPRSLVPFDYTSVIESVKKTHHLVVIEPSCRTGGVGAEIAAQVVEKAFDYLDAPIIRVTAPDYPVPFSPPLQDSYIPNQKNIEDAIRNIRGK